MCLHCWVYDYGAAYHDSPAIREAVRWIEALYEESCVGGALHIVVDDMNLEDEHLEYDPVPDLGRPLTAVERGCREALRRLTVPERASAIARQEGWTPADAERAFRSVTL